MGLRTGKYPTQATVWEVRESKGKTVDVRISCSKKNKQTGEYETDFSGYVRFCGENMVNFAKGLNEKDRIDIEEFELTNSYDKAKNMTYYNVSVFAAKKHEYEEGGSSNRSKSTNSDGFMNIPDGVEDAGLPFN